MVGIGFGNSEAGTGKNRAADAAMGVWTYSGGWKMYILGGRSQLEVVVVVVVVVEVAVEGQAVVVVRRAESVPLQN